MEYRNCGKGSKACFTEFAPLTNMHVQILNILKCVFFVISSKLYVQLKYIFVNKDNASIIFS